MPAFFLQGNAALHDFNAVFSPKIPKPAYFFKN